MFRLGNVLSAFPMIRKVYIDHRVDSDRENAYTKMKNDIMFGRGVLKTMEKHNLILLLCIRVVDERGNGACVVRTQLNRQKCVWKNGIIACHAACVKLKYWTIAHKRKQHMCARHSHAISDTAYTFTLFCTLFFAWILNDNECM